MLYLNLRLTFQGLSRRVLPDVMVNILFDSEQDRRNWRESFEELLPRLNRELNLGVMTCISPDYLAFESSGTVSRVVGWSPEEAIAQAREAYLQKTAAKAESG